MDDRPMDVEQRDTESAVHVRTFLIADIRGYTAFTRERGDEAAAELAGAFARITRDVARASSGQLAELRGDEALVVFTSTRQALRAAVALQLGYTRHTQETPGLRLPVGIGVDAGEAVPVEGGYRGAALNMAARLCSAARPGEILTTQAVSHLAGAVEGLEFDQRRLPRPKGMTEPVRAVAVSSPELRGAIEALPQRDMPGPAREPTDFTAQLGALLDAHLGDINERVAEEVAFLQDMPQFQHAHLPQTTRPRPAPAAARPQAARRAPVPAPALSAQAERAWLWMLPAAVLLVIVIVAVVFWVHVH